MTRYVHDPDAVLDYAWDWSSWLETDDTISDHTVDADAGITVDSSAITDSNTTVTVWLSGGTVGTTYSVTVHVVTADGREDDRTNTFTVRER